MYLANLHLKKMYLKNLRLKNPHLKNNSFTKIILFSCCSLLFACNEDIVERETLKSIPTTQSTKKVLNTNKISTSESDIRAAYVNYLKHASKQDLSRSDALNRLAAIEFKLSEQLNQNSETQDKAQQLAKLKLNQTIKLLATALQDYPNAKSNDVTLYQLAKAYDQQDNYEQTHLALKRLVNKYPKSIYYLEAQFRLAEYAFSAKNYPLAEDKYTEIIIAKKNEVFYEKSLYKRGWSRFKQEFYIEAADDFIQVINLNNFSQYEKLTRSDKNLFDEYFRAMGLSFSYIGGADALNKYFQQTTHIDNLYYIYKSLSQTFLKEQRYNDAASTLTSFIANNPNSEFAPEAALQVIEVWKKAGFVERRNSAFEQFYQTYQPNSKYWRKQKSANKTRFEQTYIALKSLILVETATYHKKYQQDKNEQDFLHAQRWYRNYLTFFEAYSRQDNIHFLFASLYATHKSEHNAYKYYLLSGFDEQTITNKTAAYHTITIASSLLAQAQEKAQKEQWLTRLIQHSILYAQQYPNDKLTRQVIEHASNITYKNDNFAQTITLAELAVNTTAPKQLVNINTLKAHAYFQTKQYATAEIAYASLINSKLLTPKEQSTMIDGLALAIFYQGNSAKENQHIEEAIAHYARIFNVAPKTTTASAGLYDAIALSITTSQWLQAIDYIKSFRKLYPKHKYTNDIAKKLSVAYLNSKQNIAAAKELEKLSSGKNSPEYKKASLLKAAQLYQENNDISSAIRSYELYVKKYPKPFNAYIESLHHLARLNAEKKQVKKSLYWHKKIFKLDKKTPATSKNQRTYFIASSAALALAHKENKTFNKINLVKPLKKNLKRKKKAMQASVNYYAKASSYGIAETATESVYAIATIYNHFSQALLNSEVPKHLNIDEKEQYQFLLEDQAFPFEEKAIEFYERNLLYTKEDIYDQWIIKSEQQLQKLFPIRYKRELKLEKVINVLH